MHAAFFGRSSGRRRHGGLALARQGVSITLLEAAHAEWRRFVERAAQL
jgi:hypothetical protein